MFVGLSDSSKYFLIGLSYVRVFMWEVGVYDSKGGLIAEHVCRWDDKYVV